MHLTDEDEEDENAQGDSRNLGDDDNDEDNDGATRGRSSVPPLPQGLNSGGQTAPTSKINGIGHSSHHA